MRRFIDLPFRIYRNDPSWVSLPRREHEEILDVDSHPFYAHADMQCFLARCGNEVCGRVAAIVDRSAAMEGQERVGTFGFYESTNSQRVADALFRSAAEWLWSRGATKMRGPLSPSINYEAGLLVDGFDWPTCVMMPYNPAYYAGLFEGAGLRKSRDLYAYRLRFTNPANDQTRMHKLNRAVRVLSSSDITIRTMRTARFEEDVNALWRIHCSAWRNNWGAVPLSFDEMLHTSRKLKPILIPDLVLFAEASGQTVGCGIALPDINQMIQAAGGSRLALKGSKVPDNAQIKRLRIIALGVLETHRDSGIATKLYAQLVKNAIELGYEEAECSWVVEDNRSMNRSLEFLGVERYKTYRVYEYPLNSPVERNVCQAEG